MEVACSLLVPDCSPAMYVAILVERVGVPEPWEDMNMALEVGSDEAIHCGEVEH